MILFTASYYFKQMLGKIISCHKREHCLFKTLSQIKYCVHRNLFWSTVCFYEKLFVMCNYFLIEYWSKIFIFLIFMFTKNGHLLYRTPPVMRTPSVWVLFVVVVQSLSCVWLCRPMDCSTPGFLVLHHLPELAQTHVHWVSDTIKPSHPRSSPFSAFDLSQHQQHLF